MMMTLMALSTAMLGQAPPQLDQSTPGQLTIVDRDGKPGMMVPLQRTSVVADVAGMSARVTLVQTFVNSSQTPIEAVYTFPMPADAAVDRMRMKVGDRIVEGEIKRRSEARAIYDAARNAGQVASLLDQERPNIFTQSVANITPGAKVEIEISYVQLVKFEDGQFEFSFPMVVGPRFTGAGTPDPDRITPPITPKGTRTGTNIDLKVMLDAGAPIEEIKSVLHATGIKKQGETRAEITLSRRDEIPNRDFILRYRVSDSAVAESFVTHAEPGKGGTFCLMLAPPERPAQDTIRPKEVVFVMDQSGSQSGFPLEKSKELTKKLMNSLNPGDTFNIVAFSNGARALWPEPRENGAAAIREAEQFVDGLTANGGTVFVPAIEMALKQPPAGERVRVVVFNTDGFIGNEFEVLDLLRRYREHGRLFTFGIGNSVNRFLIDAMSVEGRGDSEVLTLAEQADAAVTRFIDRTRSPLLTDIKVRIDGVPVTDVTPEAAPDVFSQKPVVIFGRYQQAGKGQIVISGRLGGRPWERTIPVVFPASGTRGSGVTTMWARRKIDDIMRSNWLLIAAQPAEGANDIERKVTELGLKYGIMTQWTSFVAVEKRVVNVGGKQRTVAVPVEMADGVSYEMGEMGMTKSISGRGAGVGGGGGGLGSTGAPGSPVANRAGDVMAGRSEAEKIDPRLKGKTGQLEVCVFLSAWSDELLKKLAAAGLKVESQDKGLRVVFGTISSKKLEELAKIAEVSVIKPIDG